jgi:hypothetical protein
MLKKYREERLNQMKQAAFRNRFGDVVDIVKNDWIREVTEASQNCTVLVHLYEDSIVECAVMDEAMKLLAPKFKYLKFLRIKSTHAIENWPERNLPALFIYEGGNMKTQIVTLKPLNGKSTKAEGNMYTVLTHISFISCVFTLLFACLLFLHRLCILDLEWFLVQKGIVTDSELEEDPRDSRPAAGGSAGRKGGFTMSSGSVFRAAAIVGSDDDDDFGDD